MDFDTAPSLDLCCSFSGRGRTYHKKLISVRDRAVFPFSCLNQSLYEGISWALKERWMVHLIIDFIGPFAQKFVEVSKCPNGLLSGINLFGHLARALGRLCISEQIEHKFGVGSPKKAFND